MDEMNFLPLRWRWFGEGRRVEGERDPTAMRQAVLGLELGRRILVLSRGRHARASPAQGDNVHNVNASAGCFAFGRVLTTTTLSHPRHPTVTCNGQRSRGQVKPCHAINSDFQGCAR